MKTDRRRMFPASEHSDAEPGLGWVYIDPQRQAKGKHTSRAEEAIYVGFAINTSAWSFYVQERKKIVTTNQVKFSEHLFRKRRMIEKHSIDNATAMQMKNEVNFRRKCRNSGNGPHLRGKIDDFYETGFWWFFFLNTTAVT
jgi:hypothetical protein